jgi:pentatricopeptide repeat protein
VVEEMSKVNEVFYNAMIARYAKNGQGGKAIILFHRMQRTEPKLSKFALLNIPRESANLEAMEDDTHLHFTVIKIVFELDPFGKLST